MNISTIRELTEYLNDNSSISNRLICNVIEALGYDPDDNTPDEFKQLSENFQDCSEYGAGNGFTGFTYDNETTAFFLENRQDIINHMEQTAAGSGTDIISMVQNFGVFHRSEKPTLSEVGTALWDTSQTWEELTSLYNVFAWYALEEVSRTWYRYLEEHPSMKSVFSA
jgi:hypothetical protein